MRRRYGNTVTADSGTDGKYLLAVGESGLMRSSDFGKTWKAADTGLPGVLPEQTFPSLSADGKYQTCCIGDYYVHSDNYGETWGKKRLFYSGQAAIRSCGISPDGRHRVACVGTEMKTSDDYGENWRTFNVGSFGIPSVPSLSAGGLYRLIPCLSGYRLPGGAFMFAGQGSAPTPVPSLQGKDCLSSAMSHDGRYQWVVCISEGAYRSEDYGATWSRADNAPPFMQASLSFSGEGRYGFLAPLSYDMQTFKPVPSSLFVSPDYGASWSPCGRLGERVYLSCSVSADGKIVYVTDKDGEIYRSTDYGTSWITLSTQGFKAQIISTNK